MLGVGSDFLIKEALKNVCCSYGWSYGVFWAFDRTNSLLLTLKDAHFEEHMGALADYMLLQVHILDTGVIGRTACSKGHNWMFLDNSSESQKALGSFENPEVFKDDSEIYCQFSMGIKTIALISVEDLGVVHLGSTHKISESKDFVDNVKNLFLGIIGQNMKLENEPASSDSRFYDSNKQLSSVSCSRFLNDNLQRGLDSEGFMLATHSSCRKSDQEFFEDFFNAQKSKLLDSTDCDAQRSTVSLTLEDLFQDHNFPMNDLYQRIFPLPNECSIAFATSLDNTVIEVSRLSGNESPISFAENLPNRSGRSSITEAFHSKHGPEELYNSLKSKNSGRIVQRHWKETLIPLLDDDDAHFSADASVCLSDRYFGVKTSESLLPELGSNPLLDNFASRPCSSFRSRIEARPSSASKRRRTESIDQLKIGLPNFDEKLKSFSPSYSSDMINTSYPNTEACPKDTISCVTPKSREEPAKTVKKVKRGTKPRPKDRQMFQDCLAELRKLIPNGEKMIIDRLLQQTIKHLNFMQSVTMHAETMEQIEKTKNGAILRDHSSDVGGVTWACEVHDQTIVCPLLIEDLSIRGLTSIEILFKEQGSFLAIVDAIQSFGLTIIKGVMEVGETKIWAHFIVQSEGNLPVMRHEIFSSLVRLLQMTGHGTTSANKDFGMSSSAPLFADYQPLVSLPVDFAGSLQDLMF